MSTEEAEAEGGRAAGRTRVPLYPAIAYASSPERHLGNLCFCPSRMVPSLIPDGSGATANGYHRYLYHFHGSGDVFFAFDYCAPDAQPGVLIAFYNCSHMVSIL